ncbi:MAG: cysteine--tRNA ligase [Thermaerobacter sp.]|nr:cysteine--tRNA ligase [Thermaerobacter sp.]
MLAVYDTATGTVRPFASRVPGQVSAYVCGITPYAEAHLGHARPAVVWDVITRHLQHRGYRVTLVVNITDVDDRLIERAAATGVPVAALAEENAARYLADMRRLGVEEPTYLSRATENLEPIVTLIERLLARGAAYQAGGDVYMRVRSIPDYGALSHRRLDDLLVGVRITPNPHKADPLDFALWKGARPGEPSWPAPFGWGRPGWHIECSAMAWRYLGNWVDLHGGGVDLVFPHHENERVQTRAALDPQDGPGVGYWVHNGMVTTSGVKMSKSLGNGTALSDLIQRHGAAAVRGYLLSVHYRSPLEFSEAGMIEVARGLDRVARLWDTVKDAPPAAAPLPGELGETLFQFPMRLDAALDADFNTPAALGHLFDMVRAANSLIADGTLAAFGLARRNLLVARDALGLVLTTGGSAGPPRELASGPPAAVAALVAERTKARAAGDFTRADALRHKIQDAGWVVEDRRDGPVLRPRREA